MWAAYETCITPIWCHVIFTSGGNTPGFEQGGEEMTQVPANRIRSNKKARVLLSLVTKPSVGPPGAVLPKLSEAAVRCVDMWAEGATWRWLQCRHQPLHRPPATTLHSIRGSSSWQAAAANTAISTQRISTTIISTQQQYLHSWYLHSGSDHHRLEQLSPAADCLRYSQLTDPHRPGRRCGYWLQLPSRIYHTSTASKENLPHFYISDEEDFAVILKRIKQYLIARQHSI